MNKILNAYIKAAKNSFQDLIKSWIILPASVLAYLLYLQVMQIFAPMGFSGGFVIGFAEIALLALYYGWLSEAYSRQGLHLKNLFDYDYQLFFNIISVAFIIFIVQFLVSSFAQSIPDLAFLPLFVQLAIVILFNALPEVLYISRDESVPALQHAATFTKTYWIEWFLPYLLLLSPAIFISQKGAVALFASSSEFLPIRVIIQGWGWLGYQSILFSLAGLVLGTWFMLFRAHLFEQLD